MPLLRQLSHKSHQLLAAQRYLQCSKQCVRSFSTAGSGQFKDTDAVILSAVRTPIGALQGSISSLSATQLGTITIKEALKRAQIPSNDHINEVILGNVVAANLGQAPSTQVSLGAGLPSTIPTTSINKVCSSGLKSVMFATQSIRLGDNHVVVAGGFESMSNIPYYLPKVRQGLHLGHGQLVDGLIKDGLWDVYDDFHMGNCGEKCAKDYSISREQQDDYALESYARAQQASNSGVFDSEIVGVPVKSRKGETVVTKDDEPHKLQKDKVKTLRSAFQKDGTITAANASKLNDGAANIVVVSGAYAKKHGLKPIAVIRGYADAQRKPVDFTIAPADAIPKSLQHAGLQQSDVDLWEINEAFSVVAIANTQLLKLDPKTVNVHGGAVALGHPIGASGARIFVTLLNALKQKDKRIGVAAICNGGGGASSVVVERLQ